MRQSRLTNSAARLRNQVPTKFLETMAFLGLDNAVVALAERQNCEINTTRYLRSKSYRPRYQTCNVPPKHARFVTQAIPKDLLRLPFRYFVEPLGKGSFLRLAERLPRSVTVSQIVEFLNNGVSPHPSIASVSQVKPQMIAALSFHSQMFQLSNILRREHDVLDYVFGKEVSEEQLIDAMFFLDRDSGDSLEKHRNKDELLQSLRNLTVDSAYQINRWRTASFDLFLRERTLYSRMMGVGAQGSNVSDREANNGTLPRLSIFSLASCSHSSNIKNKAALMHRVGLSYTRDTTLFEEPFRRLFFDKKACAKLKQFLERSSC
jgi:hypothetical protein